MAPLSSESICLMNALRDANGGALAVDYIVETHGRRPLTALHKRDFVTFVNYANGEHAILTDAGLDFGGPQ